MGTLEYGMRLEAVITAVDDERIALDLPSIERQTEIARHTLHDLDDLSVGTAIEVFVEDPSAETFAVSQKMAWGLALWDRLELAERRGSWVKGEVVGINPGGMVVDVGLRGFVPNRQARLRQHENLHRQVGRVLDFAVTKFDRKRGEVTLSRRIPLEIERQKQAQTTLKNLAVGDTVDGHVVSLTDYGAFIDIDGVDGMAHLGDLSWGRPNHPSEVLTLGQAVQAKVLEVSAGEQKVRLGLKQLQVDPWLGLAERYPVGEKLRGRVVSLKDYGAFVEIEAGIEGMVHVSEMDWAQAPRRAQDKFSVGDAIEVVILDIDESERRLSLGHKQTIANPWLKLVDDFPEGHRFTTEVLRKTDFGLFCRMTEQIDGLVHKNDLAWQGNADAQLEAIEVGSTLEVVVRRIDTESQRASLSIKHLQADPWREFAKAHPRGSVVEGEIKTLQERGCVIAVGELEGFCHIAELSETRVERVRDVVSVGQVREFAVKEVDPKKQRLSLSIKLLTQETGDYKKHMRDETPEGPSPFAAKLSAALDNE